MLGLPHSTEFNKRIPKQKFYENVVLTPQLKRTFIEQIQTIYWRHKIAASTANLAPGKGVTEIEVLEIKLNTQPLSIAVLQQLDKVIPYHLVFLLEHNGMYQAWIAYKECDQGSGKCRVKTYYHTEWLAEMDLPLKLTGLTLDQVYENFVRQIAGAPLQATTETETLAEAIARDEKRLGLQKQITSLETKVRHEKQLNRQVELNSELKKLRKELENI